MTEFEARTKLEEILDRLKVKAGDRLMLGIDMGRLPLPKYPAEMSREAFRERERKWCRFVLTVLLERLGTEGTLLVPSYSYSCGKPGSIFILETTPSEIGPFTEFFRSQTAAVRSLHPIFSVSGIGRDAGAILNNVGRSAFGAMSPFAHFAEYGIRFLCLGAELKDCITYVHHLEQNYGCPHRFNKTFDIRAVVDNKNIPGDWYAYVAYRGIDYCSDFSTLQNALEAKGLLTEASLDGSPNHIADVTDVDKTGLELLVRDSCVFVNRRFKLHFNDSLSNTNENTNVSSLVITANEVSLD